MNINPTSLRFDIAAYNMNKSSGNGLQFPPLKPDVFVWRVKPEIDLRVDVNKVKKFFAETYRKIKQAPTVEEKLEIANLSTLDLGNLINPKGINQGVKLNNNQNEFISVRRHEINDNFVSEFQLHNCLVGCGNISFSEKEYGIVFGKFASNVLNSLKRYEFFLEKGLDKNTMEPKKIFEMSKGFAQNWIQKNKIESKVVSADILNDFNKGIYIQDESGKRIRLNDFDLYQVWSNLFQNAAKYGKYDSNVTSIFERQNQDGKRFLSYTIRDEGIGIPPSQKEMVLEGIRAENAVASGRPGSGKGIRMINNILRKYSSKLEISPPLKPYITDRLGNKVENKYPGTEIGFSLRLLDAES